VGDLSTLKRVKRKSKTALKLKEQKMTKSQRRMRGKKDEGGRKGGGSNGFGDDDGYDLPPEGEDEFDMNDLMGSVKKQKHKSNQLLEPKSDAKLATVVPSGAEKWTPQAEREDLRGVGVAPKGDSAGSGAKQKNSAATSKYKDDGTLIITSKTSTREIIAHCNNPDSKKNTNNGTAAYGSSKQEKRKAFCEKKKLKKRNRSGGALDDDDDEDFANQQALQALHSQPNPSSVQQKQAKPNKKHLSKQENYSDTLVARSVMDDQVERPPTFTRLPRGADKLAKNIKKAKHSNNNDNSGGNSMGEEGDQQKSERIRKEQQALEAMREKVMKQYAVLKERRRNGGR